MEERLKFLENEFIENDNNVTASGDEDASTLSLAEIQDKMPTPYSDKNKSEKLVP